MVPWDSIYFFDGIVEREREREGGEKTGSRAQHRKNLSEWKKRGTCHNSTKHEFLFPFSFSFSSFFFFGKVDYAQRANFFSLLFSTPVTIPPLRCTNRETIRRRALFTFYLRSSLSTPPRFREVDHKVIPRFRDNAYYIVSLRWFWSCFLLFVEFRTFTGKGRERERAHTLLWFYREGLI